MDIFSNITRAPTGYILFVNFRDNWIAEVLTTSLTSMKYFPMPTFFPWVYLKIFPVWYIKQQASAQRIEWQTQNWTLHLLRGAWFQESWGDSQVARFPPARFSEGSTSSYSLSSGCSQSQFLQAFVSPALSWLLSYISFLICHIGTSHSFKHSATQFRKAPFYWQVNVLSVATGKSIFSHSFHYYVNERGEVVLKQTFQRYKFLMEKWLSSIIWKYKLENILKLI